MQKENSAINKTRYISVNRDRVVNQMKQAKKPRQTFGEPQVQPTNPTAFLKSNSRQQAVQPCQMKTFKDQCCQERRPPVPKRWEKPPRYPPSNINFINANTQSLLEYQRIPNERKKVDHQSGHTIDIQNSGFVPFHILRKNFGKIPPYLEKELSSENQGRPESHVTKNSNARTNSESNDSFATLQDLRQRWTEKENLLTTLAISRAHRREAIEDELRAIERQIRSLLSLH